MKTSIQSKPNHAYVKPLVTCALLVSLCLSGVKVSAVILASDTFDLTGGLRVAGNPVYGATTMVGGAVWQGVEDLRFAGNVTNGYMTPNYANLYGEGGGTAAVPIVMGAANTVKVTVDVYGIKSPPADSGVTIGIGDTSASASWGANGVLAQLWGPYSANPGMIQMFKQNTTGFGASIYAYDAINHPDGYAYNATGFNTYSIEYDKAANAFRLTANGVQTTWESLGAFTPTIAFAGVGIRGGNGWNSSQFDNFVVSNDTVVPEPASLGLLAIGGLLLSGWRRRRA